MSEGRVYFILPVIAFIVATLIYLFFISSLPSFGPEGTRFVNILDFYPEIPEGSIIFIGESQVRENVNCEIIENNSNQTCFNLGLNGIMPVQLALQKDLIISTKPDTVVIGITSSLFDETINQNEDLFMILNGKVVADDFMKERLYDREGELLSLNFYERALFKRKFILPFYLAVIKQIISPVENRISVVNNFKNPHFFNYNHSVEELSERLSDPIINSIFHVENGAKRQREAYSYLVSELIAAKIKVVVIQMPLHPLIEQNIPPESTKLFNDYVMELDNTYDFQLINMQDDFTAQYFTDLTHLNEQGATIFSNKLVEGDDNIIQ